MNDLDKFLADNLIEAPGASEPLMDIFNRFVTEWTYDKFQEELIARDYVIGRRPLVLHLGNVVMRKHRLINGYGGFLVSS